MSILNLVKKLFNSEASVKPTHLAETECDGFQPAQIEHAKFIFKTILMEAKNGHFNKDYLLSACQPGLLKQIDCSIKENKCPTSSGELESRIFVELDGSEPVGFSWCREYGNTQPKEYELYLMAVSPTFRRSGFGKKLLDESIKQFPSGTRLHMRLYKVSAVMHGIALKKGFTKSKRQNAEATHLQFICK